MNPLEKVAITEWRPKSKLYVLTQYFSLSEKTVAKIKQLTVSSTSLQLLPSCLKKPNKIPRSDGNRTTEEVHVPSLNKL